jgi:hypothetical protein
MNKILKYIIVIIIVIIIYNIIRSNITIIDSFNNDENKFILFIKENLLNDKKNLVIIPHTEMGDAFVMNGAIRYYSNIYDKIIYVCKGVYYEQISFMYSDNKNILIYPIYVGNEIYSEIVKYIQIDEKMIDTFNNYNIDFIPMKYFKDIYNPRILSDTKLKTNNDLINYPFFMYDELDLDPNIRYIQFKINRDYNRENELYTKLINIIGQDYIIIIDDRIRNYNIDLNYIENKNLPIFYMGNNSQNTIDELDEIRDPQIVNNIKILENAKEIHTIESSIYVLLDQMNINENIYVHAYLRNGNIDKKVMFYTDNNIFKYIYTN